MTEVKKTIKVKKPVEISEDEFDLKDDKAVEFKGQFVSAVGRRKTAMARVRLYEKGKGAIIVNGQKFNQYFSANLASLISQPMKLTGHQRDLNVSVLTRGGGKAGQAASVIHGIARALVKLEPEQLEALRTSGFLTRDRRKKERKKPGLKKARKAPQWSKR